MAGMEPCGSAREWVRALVYHLGGSEDRRSRWAMVVRERWGFKETLVVLAASYARIPLASGTGCQTASA
jgi:hypothetical protein